MLADDPGRALSRFSEIARQDLAGGNEAFARWLFTDRKLARGQLTDMDFYGFAGAEHLQKFFNYIKKFKYPHYLDKDLVEPLQEISVRNDTDVFKRLGLRADGNALRNIGLYNAQDYLFQRAYATPERQRPVRMLDFGAGHGRMANLAFAAPNATVKGYVAVDAIPASYLTQNLYYTALGHRVWDYLDERPSQVDLRSLEAQFDVFHLPTWRMDLLPSAYFDLVCCVQVLREVSSDVLFHVLREFARIVKPGGAVYIRDHIASHNPNQLPQDALMQANGFLVEFYPRVSDYADVHGVPRIWRRFDERVFTEAQ